MPCSYDHARSCIASSVTHLAAVQRPNTGAVNAVHAPVRSRTNQGGAGSSLVQRVAILHGTLAGCHKGYLVSVRCELLQADDLFAFTTASITAARAGIARGQPAPPSRFRERHFRLAASCRAASVERSSSSNNPLRCSIERTRLGGSGLPQDSQLGKRLLNTMKPHSGQAGAVSEELINGTLSQGRRARR